MSGQPDNPSRVLSPHGTRLFQELAELIQVYANIQESFEIKVERPSGEAGYVGLANGCVVHARLGEIIGVPAFLAIMTWSDGTIVEKVQKPQPVSIMMGTTQLLLDAYWHGECEADEFLRAPTATQFEGGVMAGPPPTPIDFDLGVEAEMIFDGMEPAFNASDAEMREALLELEELDGFIAAAIGNSSGGDTLAFEQADASFDVVAAVAVNAEVVKAKMKAMKALKLSTGIEDILITLGDQYHLIRPLRDDPALFFYLALDRQDSNLALARISLTRVDAAMDVRVTRRERA